jgi:C1A family cysteine protease
MIQFPLLLKSSLPSLIDLRNKMPPVVDQGNLGSCTANALCSLISFIAPKINGSRLFLYYNERKAINTTKIDSGAYIHDGVYSLRINGICQETSWPYIINKFTVAPPPSCYKEALVHKVLSIRNVDNTMFNMKNALLSGIPFAVGILVFPSFLSSKVSSSGMVPMPSRNEKPIGGHAICCVGYDDTKQVWIMRNSWGTSWGDNGYFYLPYAYLTNNSYTTDLWCVLSVTNPDKA